jgi:beta-ribofuranosylaminobenzene 5'-phosphate synthase
MFARNVLVRVPPRIHLGLLSMHDGAPRINGGIGFAVDQPRAHIEVRESSQLSVQDHRPFPMAPDELAQLTKSLELFTRTHRLRRWADIRIFGGMLTHVGMGSATAIRLGATEALALLNDFPLAREALVAASGRGGTSGIGINSYFDGGLVCDLGRPNDKNSFAPSSQVRLTRLPLALPAIPMPDWPMLLCVSRAIASKTQQEEIAFFKRTTPLPPSASFEASYIALFEIYATVVEGDYAAFCYGVEHMQQTVWKHAERVEYGCALAALDGALHQAGADCVGMSSLGPMLFCFANPARFASITAAARAMGCDVHYTSPTNRGREILLNDA